MRLRWLTWRAETRTAREHLEASRADRPAVDEVARDLRRERYVNNIAVRLRRAYGGR